ncbi:hypothetical protein MWU75_17540 [Ornithinimicrobium sp. F0845]|uniref:hypothetical protein n=1 Tax=Ornithinimicrobium sp. F0845 TaxID=2926412 RepID=UPI001FF3F22C|nr:hypothetical protein [Ornithinimicrobium sp. F0845]MCK0113948.1 hypothetical protein [Ornithinimicrobium sp. F0845]
MTEEQPEPLSGREGAARARATRNNKRQAWLYIVIGVALGVLAVIGLVGDDRGILDWLLLALAVINLVVGVMALVRPDPRLDDPTEP